MKYNSTKLTERFIKSYVYSYKNYIAFRAIETIGEELPMKKKEISPLSPWQPYFPVYIETGIVPCDGKGDMG